MALPYKNKKTPDDLILSIHDELANSDVIEKYSRERTLKSYLHNIHNNIINYLSYRDDLASKEQFNISWILGLLSFVAISLLLIGSQSDHTIDWVRNNQLPLRLWGIALAAIYVGASLERSSLFKVLWKFSSTKVIVSIGFSAVVVYSSGKAASIINSIFGVDAAALAISYAFTTGLIVFKLVTPFIFFISLAAVLHLFYALVWARSQWRGETFNIPPYHSFIFPLLASILMYNCWSWSNDKLDKEALQEKVYMMAHALDFNSNNQCDNLKKGIPVIFLGSSQEYVLADSHKMDELDFSTFFNARVDVPDKFYRIECALLRTPK